ncbi:HPP family protein [Pseudonocardia sp. GCM10023141]|uniref:CBS domain-containing protein n=1 Tax=Pseudonocardia sp. GCM10023141 TaxID=3252653 RepID=UPI003617DD98
MIVRDIMTRSVVTVRPQTPIHDALVLLAEHGFTAMPVVDDDDALCGLLSEGDAMSEIVHHDAHSRELHDELAAPPPPRRVSEVMTAEVTTVDPWTDVAELVQLMRRRGIRSVPVVEPDAGLVGIVSRRDILRRFTRPDSDIAADVRRSLAEFAGRGRWDVSVSHGVVELGDPYEDVDEQHPAKVVAAAVPGVVDVRVVPAG